MQLSSYCSFLSNSITKCIFTAHRQLVNLPSSLLPQFSLLLRMLLLQQEQRQVFRVYFHLTVLQLWREYAWPVWISLPRRYTNVVTNGAQANTYSLIDYLVA